MPLDLATRIRALELAVAVGDSADTVVDAANRFVAFLEAAPVDAPQVIGGVVGKPRKAKAAEPAPVVAVAEPEPVAEVVEVAPEPTPAPTPAPRRIDTMVTEADVRAVVGKLATNAAAGGAAKAREILGLFGASNLSTLKADNYADAKAAIEAVLAKAAA